MGLPIYVVGSSNTDMVVKTDKLPLPGETVIGGTFLMNPGGKGANQAVAAARLGGQVTFVARIGDDVFGAEAIAQFQRENINTAFITKDKLHPSGIALINVDARGENCIAVASGANAQLGIGDVEQSLKSINGQAILLLQLEIPLDTVRYTVDQGYEKNMKVILNPAPANTLKEEIFPHLFAVTPNESEAERLTGIKVNSIESAEKAAHILHQKGASNVVITLGSKGAYLFNSETSQLIAAPPVVAVDTTAAGDCFNGALHLCLRSSLT